jgi:hypothetical protein
MFNLISLSTALLVLLLISSAHAHYVWLERDGDSCRVAGRYPECNSRAVVF